MIALYIVGGLLLLVILLLLLPVSVLLCYDGSFTVTAQVGPKHFRLFPTGGTNGNKRKKDADEGENKKRQRAPQKEQKGKLTFAEFRGLWEALWQGIERCLRVTRRRVVIMPLTLTVTFGGDDPAEAAKQYGWANSTMWRLMPHLEELVRLRDPHIRLVPDFDAPKTTVQGRCGIRCRAGGLAAIAAAAGLPLLRWWRRHRNNRKKQGEVSAVKQTETVSDEHSVIANE